MSDCENLPGSLRTENGYAHVHEVSGYGVDINEEEAAKYPIQDVYPFIRAVRPQAFPEAPIVTNAVQKMTAGSLTHGYFGPYCPPFIRNGTGCFAAVISFRDTFVSAYTDPPKENVATRLPSILTPIGWAVGTSLR